MQEPKVVKCPYCNNDTEFMSSKEFYGRDFGTNVYVCWVCDAYVGTHKNSVKPLGTPANEHLRGLRREAHCIVDTFWKTLAIESRSATYRWIAETMQLHKDKAHIGMFNEKQCEEIIMKGLNRVAEVCHDKKNKRRYERQKSQEKQRDAQRKNTQSLGIKSKSTPSFTINSIKGGRKVN